MTEVVFIGEAWGAEEARLRHPFVGAAGQELSRMLHQAGFSIPLLPYQFNSSVRMLKVWEQFPYPFLNVFNERPPENEVSYFYAKSAAHVPLARQFPARRFDNANHYLKEEFAYHLENLYASLTTLQPNLIVALGNTALWALGLPPSISKLRGSIVETPYGKLLPTFHPASVLRKWEERTIGILDLHKAYREKSSPNITTLPREIWTRTSIEDLYRWWDEHGSKSKLLAFDIETLNNQQISEVGFASDPQHALHIPFVWREAKQYKSWWPDAKTELAAWDFVKMVCESDVPKIGQNVTQYDAYWMIKELGIQVRNIAHDTMVMSHAWNPELEKSLGFLGSIFLNEKSWKHIRHDTAKQND